MKRLARKRVVLGWAIQWACLITALWATPAGPSDSCLTAHGPEVQINSSSVFDPWPALTRHGDGTTVVVWDGSGLDGNSYGLVGQRLSPEGSPRGGEFQVNSFTSGDQYYPDVTSLPGGSFVVVWHGQGAGDESGTGIFGQRFASDGERLGDEFRINTSTYEDQQFPSVDADADGNFLVIWEGYEDYFGPGISGQWFSSDGSRIGDEFQVNSYTFGGQEKPDVGVTADGRAAIVWQSSGQAPTSADVMMRLLSAEGAPLGQDLMVNTFVTGDQAYPSIAVSATGDIVVTWQSFSQDGDGTGVVARRISSSGRPLGAEFIVNEYTAGGQMQAQVDLTMDERFVIIWAGDGPADATGVRGRSFDSAGRPMACEFQVNSSTVGNQENPGVGVDSSGDFIVTWGSWGAIEGGVYARIYTPRVFDDGFESDGTSQWSSAVSGEGLFRDHLLR